MYQIHENATELSRLTLSEQEYMQDQMMMTCVLFLVAGTYFLCCPLMTESLTCVTFDIARFNSGNQLQKNSHNIWHLSKFILENWNLGPLKPQLKELDNSEFDQAS